MIKKVVITLILLVVVIGGGGGAYLLLAPNFASTLAEHNENARRYREELNRRGIY